MSGIRAAAAVHVMLSLMAWSVAVAHEDDSAAAAAAGAGGGGGGDALVAWGLQDQTAAVGRLFELQLPSAENRTAFTVSTSPDFLVRSRIFQEMDLYHFAKSQIPSLHFLQISNLSRLNLKSNIKSCTKINK